MLVVEQGSRRRHGIGPQSGRAAIWEVDPCASSSPRRAWRSRARPGWSTGRGVGAFRVASHGTGGRGAFKREVVIAFDNRMRGPRRDDRVRINERIRVREVRVIDETGQQLGIMAPAQAVAWPIEGSRSGRGCATAVPPVCRITDYGKYQYNEQKKQRQARKHQKTIEVKEVKFRPRSTSA